MSDPITHIVMSGGNVRGYYQAGILKKIEEKIKEQCHLPEAKRTH